MCVLLGAAARGELGALSAISLEAGVEMSAVYGERLWCRGLQKYACAGGTEPHVLGLHSFCVRALSKPLEPDTRTSQLRGGARSLTRGSPLS